MKYFEQGNKAAAHHGFSSLSDMTKTGFDMNLCWGKGFNHESLTKLLQAITGKPEDRDADKLLFYISLTQEGSKRIASYAKTFGHAGDLVNSLIRGMDLTKTIGEKPSAADPDMNQAFDTLESLLDGENIPYINIHKPSYITHSRFWEIVTKPCRDMKEVLKGLRGWDMSASRFFIEEKLGSFVPQDSMEAWSYPGYLGSRSKPSEQLEVFNFLAEHIGHREAFISVSGSIDSSSGASDFVRALAKSNDVGHWKSIFKIDNLAEFLNTPPKGTIQNSIHDLMACSICPGITDIEGLKGVKNSVFLEMIVRGCLAERDAVILAGSNLRLKGKIAEYGLGM